MRCFSFVACIPNLRRCCFCFFEIGTTKVILFIELLFGLESRATVRDDPERVGKGYFLTFVARSLTHSLHLLPLLLLLPLSLLVRLRVR